MICSPFLALHQALFWRLTDRQTYRPSPRYFVATPKHKNLWNWPWSCWPFAGVTGSKVSVPGAAKLVFLYFFLSKYWFPCEPTLFVFIVPKGPVLLILSRLRIIQQEFIQKDSEHSSWWKRVYTEKIDIIGTPMQKTVYKSGKHWAPRGPAFEESNS